MTGPDPREAVEVTPAIRAQNPDLDTAWRTIAWWQQTCDYWRDQAEAARSARGYHWPQDEAWYAAEQERAVVEAVEALLDDLDRGNGYGGSACGVCDGHSPSWDGHSRNCKRVLPDRIRAAIATANPPADP